MFVLIPGRHHLLTNFQFRYLYRFSQTTLAVSNDRHGNRLPESKVTAVIFAVTSANHSGTRRNPLSFLHRALPIHSLSQALSVPVFVYPILDVGDRSDFAEFVIKSIAHESGATHSLTPENCIVACSTPVYSLYEHLGFRIFPAEERAEVHEDRVLPWEIVEAIAERGIDDSFVLDHMYPASRSVWLQYRLGEKVKAIFSDPLVSSDGDLTSTRDYGTYVRQMDEIADIKFQETEPFVKPGRIGDIGCAVGSWIKRASLSPVLRDSDFFGIELARPLFEICRQRKENGEFGTPNVFFAQRNAVRGLCFSESSMDCVHTGSLTHEIWSYGSPSELQAFLRNRFLELKPHGVWINRDVVGCPQSNESVFVEIQSQGQDDRLVDLEHFISDPSQRQRMLEGELRKQSPWGRFLQFVHDFRPGHPRIEYRIVQKEEKTVRIEIQRGAFQDFLLHKDYLDNWESEMHETFTFWSFDEWKSEAEKAGFRVLPASKVYTNPWIQKNRWEGEVRLFQDKTFKTTADWFPTTMVLISERLS